MIYKKENGELLCSEDDGKTWFELFKHLKEEHGLDLKDEDLK